ncbi:MAG: tail fiber protein [Candidatus Sulfotelmatobacter sp.]
MSNPYLGEVRMVAFTFAPQGWALCNGQILTISQNTALFSLLGTYYGGNGTSNFALPNMQASLPLAAGNGNGLTPRSLGESGGSFAVSLLTSQMPSHNHGVNCDSGGGTSSSPAGALWANDGSGRGINLYATSLGTSQVMNNAALQMNGNNLPHTNMPPYLGISFIIALTGMYPTRG